MKDIDWSKAPEGATHYGPGGGGWVASWYIVGENTLSTMLDDGIDDEWDRREIDRQDRFSLLPLLISRPATPQWNSTGLPPVGAVCEVMSTTASGEWLEATIVAHDGDKAVYRLYDGSYGADPEFFEGNPARPLFRPIRTPEQIAADERETAIKDMVDRFALHSHPDTPWRALFEQMYDCGCRMTAEDER